MSVSMNLNLIFPKTVAFVSYEIVDESFGLGIHKKTVRVRF